MKYCDVSGIRFREGLKQRTITRDLEWGIKAPFKGAENKVIYVWAEAVLGYVTAVKELFSGKKKWLTYWKGKEIKQIHTIGKDNRPERQTVAEYVRGQLDRLGIGAEMEAIRWKSKRIDLPPSSLTAAD